jgi:hypothetical protein
MQLLSTLLKTPSVYVPPSMSENKFHSHAEPQAKLLYTHSKFYIDRQQSRRYKVLD